MENEKPQLDWDAVRTKLSGDKKGAYWRSLEELAETEEYKVWLDDEFPHRLSIPEVDRRTFMKVMGASLALAGLAGCRPLPQEKLVPHVKEPEDRPTGKAMYYATIMPFGGYGYPILAESHEGRPIKLDGNPTHPASMGASDVFVQAEILNLYDPDRAQDPVHEGLISTWDEFFAEIRRELAARKGKGMAILTGRVTSPSLKVRFDRFFKKYPAAKWFQYEIANNDGELEGIGPAVPIYDFSKSGAVLSLDGDFLGGSPHRVKYARDFTSLRDPKLGENMSRLYAVESAPSNTGAYADHRLPVRASEVYAIAAAIAQNLSVEGVASTPLPAGVTPAWIEAVSSDLQTRNGLVFVGDHQPAAVHAIAHAINMKIGAPVRYVKPAEANPTVKRESLKRLAAALNGGEIESLLIFGGNPVYGAPGNVKFAEAMMKSKKTAYFGYFENETSKLCGWVLPETHFLESWGDNCTLDGTVSIQQPLIEPLFQGKSLLQVMMALTDEGSTAEDAIRSAYATLATKAAWGKCLTDGWVANTQSPSVVPNPNLGAVPPAKTAGIEAVFVPDPTVHDGFYANNGWLQELPKPLTKLTWDNAVHISPQTAADLKFSDEQNVKVTSNGVTVIAPIFIQVGHPNNAVTLHMGGDRMHGGRVLHNCGFDFMKLRGDANFIPVTIEAGEGVYPLSTAQAHHSMEGRDIIREGSVAELAKNPGLHPHDEDEEEIEGLYNLTKEWADANPEMPQYAMTIDLNYCTGCNACVTACQSENNIPTVGKAEVSRGRELHWLRIDRYYKVTEGKEHRDIGTGVMEAFHFEGPLHNTGSGPIRDNEAMNPANVSTVFQPIPCMHCEVAPCEPVCPVAATVHSHEGLNQMVYNRCVGTRYCSNNCPYKVRRFNFYNYQHGQVDITFKNNDRRERLDANGKDISEDPKLGKQIGNRNFQNEKDVPLLRLINNPDVTVRGRGVMEKCTYCVQRINEARINAKKESREIRDGEIVTACQQACPTHAITFGNMADSKSAVSKKRSDHRNYTLLAHLGTRPRTTYLGRVRNPHPSLETSA